MTDDRMVVFTDRHRIMPSEASTPSRSGSKADWVEFAVAAGADREEAEAMTRDELIDEFGTN